MLPHSQKDVYSRACHAGETNPEHYIVATQERALRQTLGGLPGGASIFTNVNGMHMEPPSDSQRDATEQVANFPTSPAVCFTPRDWPYVCMYRAA